MRSDTGAFRHELKYLINEQEKNAIMERVRMFMQADSHAGNGSPASQSHTEHVNAGYMIRSCTLMIVMSAPMRRSLRVWRRGANIG